MLVNKKKGGLWCANYSLANRMARGKATIPPTSPGAPRASFVKPPIGGMRAYCIPHAARRFCFFPMRWPLVHRRRLFLLMHFATLSQSETARRVQTKPHPNPYLNLVTTLRVVMLGFGCSASLGKATRSVQATVPTRSMGTRKFRHAEHDLRVRMLPSCQTTPLKSAPTCAAAINRCC